MNHVRKIILLRTKVHKNTNLDIYSKTITPQKAVIKKYLKALSELFRKTKEIFQFLIAVISVKVILKAHSIIVACMVTNLPVFAGYVDDK